MRLFGSDGTCAVPDATLVGAPALEAVRPALEKLDKAMAGLPPDVEIIMGGGTVLAARWNHRESTDIDLFVSAEGMRRLLDDGGALLQVAADRLGLKRAEFDPWGAFLSGTVSGTSFSLAASEFLRQGIRREAVLGTRFRAASTEEILAGKICGRLHQVNPDGSSPRPPVRDIHDIVVAALLSPGAVQSVLDGLPQKGRRFIAQGLRSHPPGGYGKDPKPVTQERHRVVYAEAVQELADAIEAGDESLLPSAPTLTGAEADQQRRGRFPWIRRRRGNRSWGPKP